MQPLQTGPQLAVEAAEAVLMIVPSVAPIDLVARLAIVPSVVAAVGPSPRCGAGIPGARRIGADDHRIGMRHHPHTPLMHHAAGRSGCEDRPGHGEHYRQPRDPDRLHRLSSLSVDHPPAHGGRWGQVSEWHATMARQCSRYGLIMADKCSDSGQAAASRLSCHREEGRARRGYRGSPAARTASEPDACGGRAGSARPRAGAPMPLPTCSAGTAPPPRTGRG